MNTHPDHPTEQHNPNPSQDESLAEITEAWNHEIERRVQLLEERKTELFDAADVFAEARRIAS